MFLFVCLFLFCFVLFYATKPLEVASTGHSYNVVVIVANDVVIFTIYTVIFSNYVEIIIMTCF